MKLYKHFIPIAVLVCLCQGCKLSKRNIAGYYYDYGNFENSTRLFVNRDGTFDFKLQAGVAFFVSQGRWEMKGDSLVLNNSDSAAIPPEVRRIVFIKRKGKLIEYIPALNKEGVVLKRGLTKK